MTERLPKNIYPEMIDPQLESTPAAESTIKKLRDTVAAKLRKNSYGLINTRGGSYICIKSAQNVVISEQGSEGTSYTISTPDEDTYVITKDQDQFDAKEAGKVVYIKEAPVSEGELQRLTNQLHAGRFRLLGN